MGQGRLIILGASITALAVVRAAWRLGLSPVVFDVAPGIACSSSLAEIQIRRNLTSGALIEYLMRLGDNRNNFLVATSDVWLRILKEHRAQFDHHYERVWHPRNEALEVCLGKLEFVNWCQANSLPAPRLYELDAVGQTSVPIKFPVLIRPSQTLHGNSGPKLPKALQVENPDDLRGWVQQLRRAGVEPITSQSLLGQNLVQYSVPAARADGKMVSFVARKVRPLAESCAVGTYVELAPNDEVEGLARKALDLLDYYGIAEVEILHCRDSGENYLIEINARPWAQLSLAMASGHDLVAFMRNPSGYRADRELKTGKRWIDFRSDAFYCLSRSEGLLWKGKLRLADYLISLLRANVYAKFCAHDIRPFLNDTAELLTTLLRKRKRLNPTSAKNLT